ncbi:uncharacterized protein V2V93DRAFT_370157 [Kockiozyma suomiensis]|uniref:uncharacterized protein n=1 Tax=Kockiozyma suomiensis TaxID=1337062 RepID=UPI003343715D
MKENLFSTDCYGVFLTKKYENLINSIFPVYTSLKFGCSNPDQLSESIKNEPIQSKITRGIPFTTLNFISNLTKRAGIEHVSISGIRFLARPKLPQLYLYSSIRKLSVECCWISQKLVFTFCESVPTVSADDTEPAIPQTFLSIGKSANNTATVLTIEDRAQRRLLQKIVFRSNADSESATRYSIECVLDEYKSDTEHPP